MNRAVAQTPAGSIRRIVLRGDPKEMDVNVTRKSMSGEAPDLIAKRGSRRTTFYESTKHNLRIDGEDEPLVMATGAAKNPLKSQRGGPIS